MSISTKNKHNHLLMFILTLGVFGILNTEMGVVGIIPIIAETFGVTVPDAGWTVSLFALIIAFSRISFRSGCSMTLLYDSSHHRARFHGYKCRSKSPPFSFS